MAKITDLWDPTLAVEGTEADIAARARRVVEPRMYEALAVAAYKRRLGPVGGAALAADKKCARRCASSLIMALHTIEGEEVDWNTAKANVPAEARVVAATLRWEVWLPAVIADCRREAVWAATWVMKINLQSKFAKAIATRLDYVAGRLCAFVPVDENE